MNICEQAEAFRLLLLMGAVSVSDIVVSWADGFIVAHDKTPEWLIDVSLAANDGAEKMESKLRDLPCEASGVTAAYAAIERLAEDYKSGKMPASVAAQMLEVWAASAKISQDDWTAAMEPSWIADEIGYGYTSEDQLVSSIRCFLERIAAARNAG